MLAAALHAQETADPAGESTDNEIEVVAPRTNRADADAVAGSADSIPLDDYRGRYPQLDELLEKESGVRVQRYGGLGSYSTLSIRGSNANQVNVYLDGIPLNNAQGGEVNLSDLNIENVSRVDVYRSGAPGEFSGSSIGGSVNLVPDRGEGANGTRLTFSGGSFGTYRLAAQAWGGAFGEEPLTEDKLLPEGDVDAGQADARDDVEYDAPPGDDEQPLRYSLGGGYARSDQDYKFRNNNGTPVLNTFDDFDDIRKNAQFRDVFATGFGSYQWSNTEIKLLEDYRYRQHGVPGPGSNQSEKTEREYWRSTTGLGTDTKGLGFDALRLKSRAFYTESRENFFDPLQEFGAGVPNSSSRFQSYGGHLIPELYLLDYHQILRFFGAVERETYQRENRNRFHQRVETEPKKFRNHSALTIQDELRFFDRRLVFLPSVQFERYTDRFNDPDQIRFSANPFEADEVERRFTNYEAALKVVPLKISGFELFLTSTAATRSRVPTFFELFGEQGSVQGNPDLEPEDAEAVDGGPGLTWTRPQFRFEASAVYFQRWVRDMILFVPNSQFSLRPENVDSAEIDGVEFSAKLNLFDMIEGYNNYTYQRAINTSDVEFLEGKYLPLRPLHENHSGLKFYNEHWELGGELIFVGAVFKDRTNEAANYEPSRWISNAFVSYSVYGRSKRDETELLVGLEVKNITNERVADVVGYPLPGRSIYGTVTYRF